MKKRKLKFVVCLLLVSMLFTGGIQGFAQNEDGNSEDNEIEKPIEDEKEKVKEELKFTYFEMELLLTDKTEMEWEYARKKKKVKAEIERGDKEIEGFQAIKEMEKLLSKVEITDDMNNDEIVTHLLELVEINPTDVKKFELKIKCDNGKKIKIKQKQ
ncbi:YusW family protein [Evansella sp. AB-P1]|uniref:YusW family protein n=1 Tax=Evansella sp. AB-P1 TaxID=3037653 RepID=UPI00241F23B0|nr:YusW family protein [Evansella sp. AB-P1]MDG5789713.1 YusW family protein [Evansella sp. AB-P1]